MSRNHDEDVLNTYRYLRLGLVFLVLLLALAVVWEVFSSSPHCLQQSISAYWYTPVRGVFVGALAAIGICLIVYQGDTNLDDVSLNFSGATAFVVALVPTPLDATCKATSQSHGAIRDAVHVGMWALLATGVVAVVVARIVNPETFRLTGWTPVEKAWLALTSTALAAGAVWFVAGPDSFARDAHTVAAFAMFAGVLVVAGSNALSYRTHRPGPANPYGWIGIAMVVSLVSVLVAHWADTGWYQWPFWLEAAIIGEFAVFWGVQTKELWHRTHRGEPGGVSSSPGRRSRPGG